MEQDFFTPSECQKNSYTEAFDFGFDFEVVFSSLKYFKNENEARRVLKIGKNKRANIIDRIPNTAYYKKVCASPRCDRVFEGTIRGLYCNYPRGRNGSSCRKYVERLKLNARRYLLASKLSIILILFLLSFYALRGHQE